MRVHRCGCAVTRSHQHRRPEKGVEVNDIFSHKVVQLCVSIRIPPFLEVKIDSIAQFLETGHVTNGRVYPDIEVLVFGAGNPETEIGFITGYIPVTQTIIEPLLHLVDDFGLQGPGRHPVLQKILEFGKLDKMMLRITHDRCGAADCRTRLDQVSRTVVAPTGFATVTILVFGFALGTGSLDEAVRQKHLLLFIIELGYCAAHHMTALYKAVVNGFNTFAIGLAMGGGIVVKTQAEIPEVLLMLGIHPVNQFIGRDVFGLRPQHDRCAMRVVCPGKIALMSLCPLKTRPDISLDILQHMSQVDGPVCVWKGAGD